MNIKINDEYSITSDPYNIILNFHTITKTGENAGKEYIKALSYHSSIEAAISAIVDRKIKLSNAETLMELKQDIEDIKTQLAKFWPNSVNDKEISE